MKATRTRILAVVVVVAVVISAVMATQVATAAVPQAVSGGPAWSVTDSNGVTLTISLSGPIPTVTVTPAPPTNTPVPPTATATKPPVISTPTPGVGNCLGVPAYPEIRVANTKYNNTQAPKLDPAHRNWITGFGPYYDKVDGLGCVNGTTEQILEWAALKWGLDKLPTGSKDLVKAAAVQESDWYQRVRGDSEACTQNWCFPSPGFYGNTYQTYGLTGIKRTAWAGTWDKSHTSTAFAADFYGAGIRAYYDGAITWAPGTKGNLDRAIGAWFCGCDTGSGAYTADVRRYLAEKEWTKPYFKTVGCSTNCIP
jgi:hypothetical protein